MTSPVRWVELALCLVSLPAMVLAIPPPRGSSETLARLHDPVVVSTALLQGSGSTRTAQYRLYRVSPTGVSPVPYQFDARDEDGEIVFSDHASVEDSFDDNDELVFMAKDTGDRGVARNFPAGTEGGFEIEAADPVTGDVGWVYLLRFRGEPPPPSPVVYAHYDTQTAQVRAKYYTIRYYPGSTFFTGMSIEPAAGGSGKNILDRMKLRVNPTLSLLFTTTSPLITEQDFQVRITGVKNGPVRAIRRVHQSIDLGKFFPNVPGGTTYTYYYFSSFMTPSKFSIPWLVLKSLRDFRFTGFSDFRRNVVGMTYWDGANPQGILLTGKGHPPLQTRKDHDWWAMGGRGGTCLHVFLIPPEWRKWGVTRGTVFVDDDAAVDREGPEAEPGEHAAGYSLLHMTNIRHSGSYDLNLATIILPHLYRPGDEVQPLEMLKRPLHVTVRPFSGGRVR